MKKLALIIIGLILISGCAGPYKVGSVLLGGEHVYIGPVQIPSDNTPYGKTINLKWGDQADIYDIAGKPAGIIVSNTYEQDIELELSFQDPGYTYKGYAPVSDIDVLIEGGLPANIKVKSGEMICIPVKFKTTNELPGKFWFGIRVWPKRPTEGGGAGISIRTDAVVWIMVTMEQRND